VRVAHSRGWTSAYTEQPLENASALRPGRNTLAVHCHQNRGGQYIDVGIVQYRPAATKK